MRVQRTSLSPGTSTFGFAENRESYWLRISPQATGTCASAPTPFESTVLSVESARTSAPETMHFTRASDADGGTITRDIERRTPSGSNTTISNPYASQRVPSPEYAGSSSVATPPSEHAAARVTLFTPTTRTRNSCGATMHNEQPVGTTTSRWASSGQRQVIRVCGPLGERVLPGCGPLGGWARSPSAPLSARTSPGSSHTPAGGSMRMGLPETSSVT